MCKMTKDMEDFLSTHEVRKNPDSIRNGNLVMKTMCLSLALICAGGVEWKKRRQIMPTKSRYNVMTLNETVLLVTLLYFDNTFLSYLLPLGNHTQLFFNLEMMRIILIEVIFFKFLIPVYLIVCSRTHLPALWVDSEQKHLMFYMSKPSFIPRQVISKYQIQDQSPTVKSNKKQVKANSVIINISVYDDDERLPAVVD